jgi:tight adherence protein B
VSGLLLASAAVSGGLTALGAGGSHGRLLSLAGSGSRVDEPPARPPSRRAQREASSSAPVAVPAALALELRSGRDLGSALASVAAELDAQPEVSARLRRGAAVARAGGDVQAALCGGSSVSHDWLGGVLQPTAACCSSSVSAGLPLADLLEAVAASGRTAASLRGAARAELAGARSTAVVLAALPLAGVGMGQLLGARPLAVLIGTAWGVGCLGAAAVLTTVGLLWSRAITVGLRRALS